MKRDSIEEEIVNQKLRDVNARVIRCLQRSRLFGKYGRLLVIKYGFNHDDVYVVCANDGIVTLPLARLKLVGQFQNLYSI